MDGLWRRLCIEWWFNLSLSGYPKESSSSQVLLLLFPPQIVNSTQRRPDQLGWPVSPQHPLLANEKLLHRSSIIATSLGRHSLSGSKYTKNGTCSLGRRPYFLYYIEWSVHEYGIWSQRRIRFVFFVLPDMLRSIIYQQFYWHYSVRLRSVREQAYLQAEDLATVSRIVLVLRD